jgi:hypothetical protein
VQLIQRVLILMLWVCCLSVAQEEKNEMGLLLGAEFIPEATTPSNQNLSFGRSIAYSVDYARRLSSGNTALFLEFPFAVAPSHKVESAQLNAITSLATLFVTPSLRTQFVCHAPGSPWLSGGFGYGLYEEEVAFCKTELLTRRYIGTWRQRNSAAESMSALGPNCCSRSASEARFGTSTP